MKRIALLTFLFLLTTIALGQASRVDQPILTSGPNVPSGGGPLPQTLWVANSTVYVCTHPSASLAACQGAPITTYTDSTTGTSCPSTAQLVHLPGNICTASSGVTANVGMWYGGGLADYWVVSSYGNFGPFTVSSGIGTGGSINPATQFTLPCYTAAGTSTIVGNCGANPTVDASGDVTASGFVKAQNTTIGSAAGDYGSLSANLANSGNTVASGWTGTFPNFTNGASNTGAITTTLTGLTNGGTYIIIIGNVGATAGSLDVTFQGTDMAYPCSPPELSKSYCSILATSTSGTLVITPTSTYNGSTGSSPGISVQLDTAVAAAPISIVDSTSTNVLNIWAPGNLSADLFIGGGSPYAVPSTGVGQTPNLFNTFVGPNAGALLTAGSYNSGFGWGALSHLTTGYRNAACSEEALNYLTTGSNNTGCGQGAGYQLTGASGQNDFYGTDAGVNIATGSFLTLIGESSVGTSTATSTDSTLGFLTLYYLLTGSNDLALSAYAGDGPYVSSASPYPYASTSGVGDIWEGLYTGGCSATQVNNAIVIGNASQTSTIGACAPATNAITLGNNNNNQLYVGGYPAAASVNALGYNGTTVTLTQVGIPGTPSGTPSATGGTIPANSANYLLVIGAACGGSSGLSVIPAGITGAASAISSAVTTTGSTSSIAWNWTAAANVCPLAGSYNYIVMPCQTSCSALGSGNFSHFYFVQGTTWTQTLPYSSYSGCGCSLLNAGNQTGIAIAPGGISTGSGRKGTFTCTSGGTITVTNANEILTSDVIISLNTAGGTISTAPAMNTVTAGTGFTVLCATSDTSVYNYNILN